MRFCLWISLVWSHFQPFSPGGNFLCQFHSIEVLNLSRFTRLSLGKIWFERFDMCQFFDISQLCWPDYFHIGLAHTVQILESTDSIAKYSGSKKIYIFQCKCKCIFLKAVFNPPPLAQGKESKNKYVRFFKEHFSRKSSNALSVRDILNRDWSLSSPLLRGYGKSTPVYPNRRTKCKWYDCF